jgi:AraC family transcriptional regulator
LNESKVHRECSGPKDLAAGNYYGRIIAKRELPDFLVSEISHPGRRKLPEHSHQSAYFSLLLDGSYSEVYAGRKHDYEPLTIWWHAPGIVHRDTVGDRGGRFFNVELASAASACYRTEVRFRSDFAERRSRLVWLACGILREFRDWQPCSALAVEGLALEMVGEAARKRPADSRRQPHWLGRIVERLNDEHARRHTTAELAAVAGVHPVYLACMFRRVFKVTLGEYLREVRVREASELLRHTRLPLAEIAIRLGFSDQSHFTRAFGRVVGMPPGAFRRVLSS